MDALKAWTLSICMACILAGVLQQFASSRARFSVIKLVLTLYILITAFAPLQNALQEDLLIPAMAATPNQTVDTQQVVETQIKLTLQEQLQSALDTAAPGARISQITLGQDAGGVTVTAISVFSGGASKDEITQAIADALGATVPVTVEEG